MRHLAVRLSECSSCRIEIGQESPAHFYYTICGKQGKTSRLTWDAILIGGETARAGEGPHALRTTESDWTVSGTLCPKSELHIIDVGALLRQSSQRVFNAFCPRPAARLGGKGARLQRHSVIGHI